MRTPFGQGWTGAPRLQQPGRGEAAESSPSALARRARVRQQARGIGMAFRRTGPLPSLIPGATGEPFLRQSTGAAAAAAARDHPTGVVQRCAARSWPKLAASSFLWGIVDQLGGRSPANWSMSSHGLTVGSRARRRSQSPAARAVAAGQQERCTRRAVPLVALGPGPSGRSERGAALSEGSRCPGCAGVISQLVRQVERRDSERVGQGEDVVGAAQQALPVFPPWTRSAGETRATSASATWDMPRRSRRRAQRVPRRRRVPGSSPSHGLTLRPSRPGCLVGCWCRWCGGRGGRG